MDGKASLVAFLGLSLVLASSWKSGALKDFVQSPANSLKTNGPWYSSPMGQLGYETAGILVATFVANVSDGVADVLIAVLIGLWIVWLITWAAGRGGKPAGPQPASTSTSTNKKAAA